MFSYLGKLTRSHPRERLHIDEYEKGIIIYGFPQFPCVILGDERIDKLELLLKQRKDRIKFEDAL